MLTSLLLIASGAVHAQDADTFDFSGSSFDRRGGLQLSHPQLGAANSWYAGVGLVYANDPLVREFEDGTEEAVVSHQFSTRLQGGYTIQEIVRIDVAVPIYPRVVVSGQGSFAFGDITLSGLVPIWETGDSDMGFAFAVKPFIVIPSGSTDAFTGQGGFGGGLDLAVGGYVIEDLNWRVNAGMDLSRKVALDDLNLGSTFDVGGGLDYRITEEWLAGAEVTSKVDIAGGSAWNENPIEGHIYGGYWHETGLTATLGLGTGLLAGIGAPDYRIALALGFRLPDVSDTDGDGYKDDVDACPMDPEDFDGFEDEDGCPEADNDQDGILDASDTCPLEPEDKDGWEDADGCPDPNNDDDGLIDADDDCPNEWGPDVTVGCPDRDEDNLADSEDACPDDPGPLVTNGCPDRDNDRVPDMRDECPDEPIPPQADPARSNGCPARVIVTMDKIEILDKVYFQTNRSKIKTVSYPLLDEIAETLAANPDLTLVEVAGHTDSDGKEQSNLVLSQARAEAVRTYLINKGIDESRLVAKGYGEAQPVDDNGTAEGKANNRRVEFVILEQD